MNEILLIVYIWIAFIAMSFWESSVEGRNAWDKGKLGWKLKIGRYVVTSRYHFFAILMILILISLPLVIYGWNIRLFGILLSAVASGFVIEDFFWYVFNPVVKVRELNTKFANYYPRISFGKIKIPTGYFIGIIVAVLSWLFFWR